MKIFYKKDYLKIKEELKEIKIETVELTTENTSLKRDLKEAYKNINNLKSELEHNNLILKGKEKDIINYKEQLHSEQGAKGGLTKQVNKLTKQVKELEIKLKESMTDKYLVKKIPTGKTPNTIKTKVTNKIKSSTRNYMQKEFEV